MAGFDDPEMKKLFDALNKNIQQLSKSLSQAGGSGQAAKSSQIGALKDLTQTVKKTQKQAGEFNKAVKDVTKYAQDLSKVLKDQAKSAADFAAGLNSAGKSAKNLADSMEDTQRENESATAKIIRSYKKLETGTEAYNQYVKWLGHSTKSLNASLLRQAGALDERTGKLRSDLKPDDFARLHDSLVDTQETIRKSLGRFGLSTEDLSKSQEEISAILAAGGPAAERMRRAMLRTAARLEASGINTGVGQAVAGGRVNQAAAGSVNYQQLAQTITGLNNQAATSSTALSRLGNMSSSTAGRFTFLASSLTVLQNAVKSLEAPFNELREFNTANIAGTFIDLKKTSAQLGMGFKETLEFMSKTKDLQVLAGSQENFRNRIDKITEDLKDFGYAPKDAAAVIANMSASAKAAGIDMRSGADFQNFIKDSTSSFQQLASITNTSQEQFAQLNEQLLGSTNMQKTMLGLDKNRTREYTNQLHAMRLQYTQMGMTAQQANEMLKMQEDQKRAKLSEKMKAVASIGMQASEAGLDAGEAQQLYMKQLAGTASNEEKKRLAEMMATIQKSQSARMAELTESGDTVGALVMAERQGNIDAISDLATKAKDASLAIAMGEKANTQVNDSQLKMAASAAKGSKAIAEFAHKVDQATAIMNDSFVKAGSGLLGGIGSMVANVATTAIGTMIGGGRLPGLGGGLPGLGGPAAGLGGAASRMGSLAARALPMAGSAAAVAAAGYAGYKTGEALNEYALNPLAEKITGVEGETVGTALYTGVDKVMGWFGKSDADKMKKAEEEAAIKFAKDKLAAGKMLHPSQAETLRSAGISVPASQISTPGAPPTTAKPADSADVKVTSATPVTPTPKTVGSSDTAKPEDIMAVTDKSAVEQLLHIAQNMTNAVSLLRQMSENGVKILATGTTSVVTPIPTVNTVLTSTKR